jgi:predicted amidophosphoribosyltransferase
MAQLVGQICSRCDERISNELESAFCEECRNPIHNRCRVPGANAAAPACPQCGDDLEAAARRAEEFERLWREQAERRPPPPPLDPLRYLRLYNQARLLILLALVPVVGLLNVLLGEYWPGVPLLVGSALLVFIATRARRH